MNKGILPSHFKLVDNIVGTTVPSYMKEISRKIYEETNEAVEKWSKLIQLTFVRFTMSAVFIPCFCLTYYRLYTFESNDGIYILPFNIRYVCIATCRDYRFRSIDIQIDWMKKCWANHLLGFCSRTPPPQILRCQNR